MGLGLDLHTGIDTAPEQVGPEPVDVLAERSGVSAESLRALSAEDRNGLASLEASVARVVEASQRPSGGVTRAQVQALVEARDQIRADVVARTSRPAVAEAIEAPNGLAEPDDARLRIRDNTITVEARIHIYGSGASQQVADLFERHIQADWGQNPTTGRSWTFTDRLTGREYNVHFDVSVGLFDASNTTREPGLVSGRYNFRNRENFVEVVDHAEALRRSPSGDFVSRVHGGDEGEWRTYGRNGATLAEDNPASHEFGHLLGFLDRYSYQEYTDSDGNPARRVVVAPEWRGNIMAEPAMEGRVQQKNIDALVSRYVDRSRSADPGEERVYGINEPVMRR